MRSLGKLWLSVENAKGRLCRSEYLRYSFLLFALTVGSALIVSCFVTFIFDVAISKAFFGSFIVIVLCSVPFYCILSVKRLHDIGLSGWWLLAISLAGGVLGALGGALKHTNIGMYLVIN